MTTPNSASAPGGYVRIPRAWLAVDISPQAKALLIALCAQANESGASWYGYDQLGAILRRSKAAISGYIAELRDAGLVTCQKQTYGNGYNYRLKITLVGWRDHLAAWAQGSRRKADNASHDPERRVQPAERKDPSGPINNPDQNKSPCVSAGNDRGDNPPSSPRTSTTARKASTRWSVDDERRWRAFRPDDTAPINVIAANPDPKLAGALTRAIAALEAQVAVHGNASCAEALRDCLGPLGVSGAEEAWNDGGAALDRHVANGHDLGGLIEHLRALWKSHWRRPPTPRQIDAMVAGLPAPPDAAERRAARTQLGRLRTRQWILERHERAMCHAAGP